MLQFQINLFVSVALENCRMMATWAGAGDTVLDVTDFCILFLLGPTQFPFEISLDHLPPI